MELVKDLNDILENAERADMFINGGTTEERDFMLGKISRGMCFVVIKDRDEYKFYPSKYIGYKDNNPSSYKKALDEASALPGEECKRGDAGMYDFDGRMSNKSINKILGCTCQKDYFMSERFIEYCNKLGLKGSEKKKFWLNVIEI